MSVNGYLVRRAGNAILSADEKASVDRSIRTLSTRLDAWFGRPGDGLSSHFRFGSQTRGTILPRAMDAHSDIDYMIVFEKSGFTPQTYLNRLKVFAENYYQRSDIKQSSPTVVLELNHIKFDLVPALADWSGYKIPDGPNAWRHTNPNDFNATIERVNRDNSSLVKPAVRLAKFWNAKAGYVFDSYMFEKWIAERWFWLCSNQRDYLFKIFDDLNAIEAAQWKNDRITRAKQVVTEVRRLEAAQMPASAESEVKKLIPE